MAGDMMCRFCGETIRTQEDGIHRLVSGWTSSRGSGKSVPVVLASPSHEFAHKGCIAFQQRLKQGPDQDSLFD